VADQSTYEEPSRPSTGFKYVLVGGVAVVDEGRVVESVRPGRALLGR
jgi:hypothetical protein